MGEVLIQAEGLTKIFGPLVANDHIDLAIEAGTIHAIAGENGAGKSTLMKMLYGVYPISEGRIIADGQVMETWNAAIARSKGVSMVFQDFRLIPAFTVLENVFLSLTNSGFMIDRKKLRKRILTLAQEYSLHVDPDQEVWKLDLGQRQHIEIIKVLINPDTRIMIFDEPTSVLAPHEIQSFLDMLLHFCKNGYAILLITHKINEIMTVADRITILRQGKKVCSMLRGNGFDRDEIIAKMLGESIHKISVSNKSNKDYSHLPGVSLRGVSVRDDHNQVILHDVNIALKRGRILGIAGISGNGQRELTEAIFGTRKIMRGKLCLGEEDITAACPAYRIKQGFRMVTEDPLSDNAVPNFTVLENMALVGLTVKMKHGDIDWKAMEEQLAAHTEIQDLHVPAPDRRADTLSGGNVQRMTFARAVISNPTLLLASYPSRGLDVATVAAVHRTLFRLRNEGAAILLISEDLQELFEMSDSIVVLAAHTASAPFDPNRCDVNAIGKLMLKGEGDNEASRAQ